MKPQTKLNIMTIGSLFAWIFLVLLISEIHNVKYDVINNNTLLVASSESPIEYQDVANLICKGDCAKDINTLFRFIPRVGGIVEFAPKSIVKIGSPIIFSKVACPRNVAVLNAYIVMLPGCETAFVVE